MSLRPGRAQALDPTPRWAPDNEALAGLARRWATPGWLLLAAGAAVALRAPWFGTLLGNDEGGVAYVARAWHAHGPYLYGNLFLDRPPLLLLIFRLATATGGTAAVRTIGALLAVALVVVVGLLAHELGGRRAVPWAAGLAAVLSSSPALASVFTPAELPAAVFSAGSVLALVAGHRRSAVRSRGLFAAGALALAAVLCKQSFGDALAAGAAYLGAVAVLERPGRGAVARRALAYAAGVGAVYGGVALWERLTAVPDGAMSYAMLRFRLDGLTALAASPGGLASRLADRMVIPFLVSGLALVLLWAWPGLRSLRRRPVLAWALGGWALGGLAGVMAGGSYWSHYLIELVPFAATCGALGLAHAGARRARVTAAALGALALAGLAVGPALSTNPAVEARAATVGTFVHHAARRTDTVWVRYAQANVLYYSALRTPYPYAWSLMLRTVPSAQPRLHALLSSAARPTWVVAWEHDTAYGLDGGGATARLLARHYRPVATVCRHEILLADGVTRRLPPAPRDCDGD